MMRSLYLKLASAAVGLTLAVLLAEVGLRLAGPSLATPRLPLPYDRAQFEQLASGQSRLTFEPDLGWLPNPGVERTLGRLPYRHNAAGLRADREYAPQPPPGARRLSAYGDSFTYCDDVELLDCWTAQLEALLPSGEVLNFGVPGYGPDQALLRYERDGAAWQPCAVLIGHMVENVNRVVNRFRGFYKPEGGSLLPKPRFVLEGGQLHLLPSPARDLAQVADPAWVEANLGPADAFYFPGMFVANPFDRLELVRLARTARYRALRTEGTQWTPAWAARAYQPGTEAFEVLVAVLARFAEQARRDGSSPLVVVFPYQDEITSRRDGEPKVHAPLLEALAERDVPTLDLTDPLAGQSRRGQLGSLLRMHYTRQGNAVVARALAERLPALTASTCGP